MTVVRRGGGCGDNYWRQLNRHRWLWRWWLVVAVGGVFYTKGGQ